MMTIYPIFKHKVRITLVIAILTGMHILWDYYHGGVPKHYLLAQEGLPGFSNWWGLLTLPLLTWGVISLLQKRVEKYTVLNPETKEGFSEVLIGFFGSLIFGLIMSILWELDLEYILQYLIFLPIPISLFRPLHLPEYLLGFVLGMAFTFGGVLPILFGIIILFLCFITYKILRQGTLFLLSKVT